MTCMLKGVELEPKAPMSEAQLAHAVRQVLPPEGLFAGHDWRISVAPFPLGAKLAEQLHSLGRVLLQFYRATNLLYRKSAEGKEPSWVADWLDQGKPSELIELQRSEALKNELPRVLRPDLLLTEHGFSVTELDSVPGGIGLTGWLNQTYANLGADVLGGREGMLQGFASIFGEAPQVHIVISEEAATYRPEMAWVARQLGNDRFNVRSPNFTDFTEGEAVYRFFELFDLANVPGAPKIFDLAAAKRLRLTPPPKPCLEEKMLLA